MQWNSRDRLAQFHQGHYNCLKMFEENGRNDPIDTKKKARLLQNKCSSTSQGKKSKEDKKRKSTTVTSTVPSKNTAMSTTQLTSPQSETDPKGHELSKQASISPPEINNETTALDV